MNFEEKLAASSTVWVQEGIVTPEQRVRLLARHPIQTTSNRFVAIISMVGGALLFAGVGLVISSNWQAIGDWTKIGALLVLLVSTYALGWRLKVAPGKYPKTGDAVLMLACALFLAGIALVSQIFHLNSRPATGVLIWWLGIVAVPWLTRSKGAQFVSIVAFLTWLGFEFAATDSVLQLVGGDRYNFNLFAWFAIYALLGAAILLIGLGLRGGSWSLFAAMFENWGFILAGIGLYALGFMRHDYYWRDQQYAVNWLPVLTVAAVAVVCALWAWRASRRDVLSIGPWLLAALIPAVIVLLNFDLRDGEWFDGAAWLWSKWSWIMLFVLSVFVIRHALRTGRESWVNLSIGFIALDIITSYFDVFGTMLQGGMFFIVSGVIVIALGIFLERQRRALISQLHHS